MGTELAEPPQQTTSNKATPYRDIAEAAGIEVERVEHVKRTREVKLHPNTVYAVEGKLRYDRPITGAVDDVAIVSVDGASLPVPSHDDGYNVNVSGTDFLWHNVDIDQRATGAWGRIAAKGDRMQVANVETIGHGIEPGYRHDNRRPHDYGGPTLYMPATPRSTNTIRNCDFENGGTMQYKHYGVGQLGVWLAREHKGTLRIEDSRFAAFPGDATYVTNTTGELVCVDSVFDTNGTAGGRCAKGRFENCEFIFDYENSPLNELRDTENACVAIMVEAKQGESGVTIEDCSVTLANVDKSPAAIVVRNMTTPGRVDAIRNTDIHVSDNADDAADIMVMDKGASIKSVEGCVLDGSATGGESVANYADSPISVSGTGWRYPGGRKRTRGNVDW